MRPNFSKNKTENAIFTPTLPTHYIRLNFKVMLGYTNAEQKDYY